MQAKALAGVAVAIVAVIGVGTAAVSQGDSAPQAPPGPIVAHEPGAELVYEGSREDVTVHVLEPRLVRDAGWEPVEGLPLILVQGGGEPGPDSPVVVEAVDEGGLLAKGNYCDLTEEISCQSGGFGVSWQFCRLWAAWTAPFNTMTGEEINDPPVTVEDPVSGLTWNYSVTWETDDRVRLTLQDGSAQSTYCDPDDEALVDVDSRRVLALHDDGQRHELVEVRPGAGESVPIGAEELSVSRFAAADQTSGHPYPPGAGSLGPENWTLEQAWETAREDKTVQAFLQGNPDAYLEIPSRGKGHSSDGLGLYGEQRYSWDMRLIGTSTDAIWVNVTKTTTTVGPIERTETDVETSPAVPPEDAEPGFGPPGRQIASIQEARAEAAEQGLQLVDDHPLWYSASIDPDRQDARYQYFLWIEDETATFLTPTLIVDESGRLFQLTADEDIRERVFQVNG